ncbi:MAG TPA: HU family DNA-binding protein [Desulfobacteraceae bacterium]|nr:HU family DNA-binding protein [Desulfobacteraceae bacterium]
MNKGDLINEVAKLLKTKKDANAAVNCVLSTITEKLKNNETVTLVGFGTFKTVRRQARQGRNPQTGEVINIEERVVPKFIPGKTLKDAVR